MGGFTLKSAPSTIRVTIDDVTVFANGLVNTHLY